MLVQDVSSERFAPSEAQMTVGTRMFLAYLSASIESIGMFGMIVALQRRRGREDFIAGLTSTHVWQ
jgi:hypothetical protein